MNRFIEFLERATGKKFIKVTGNPDVRRFFKIHDNIKIGKPGKKLNIITTNDLNADGKFYPNYLERRKKKRKDESIVGIPNIGIDDIWKI